MYLFIVRRYNDIDHIAPIVWKMAVSGDGPLAILCSNPAFDIKADFRLRFLREQYGVVCAYAGAVEPLGLGHRMVNNMIGWTSSRANSSGPLRSALLNRQRKYCTSDWARRLFDAWSPRVVIFDWCKPNASVAGQIVEAAKERNISMLAVPHGVNYMTNDLRTLKAVKTGIPAQWGKFLRPMDYVVVQHRRHGEWMVRCGVEPQKILIMGSTRFCREWRHVYDGLVPAVAPLSSPSRDKLRIVYMDHSATVRLNVHAIEQSLGALADRPDIELAIKPNTGDGQFSTSKLSQIAQKGEAIHSNALIDWADVVMGTTSSILLEALLRGKILLYPRFFHQNEQLFDEMGACLAVDDHAELIRAIDCLRDNSSKQPYSQENVQAFLTEVIYGGNAVRDVLGEYRDAIVAAAEGALRQGKNWEPHFERLTLASA